MRGWCPAGRRMPRFVLRSRRQRPVLVARRHLVCLLRGRVAAVVLSLRRRVSSVVLFLHVRLCRRRRLWRVWVLVLMLDLHVLHRSVPPSGRTVSALARPRGGLAELCDVLRHRRSRRRRVRRRLRWLLLLVRLLQLLRLLLLALRCLRCLCRHMSRSSRAIPPGGRLRRRPAELREHAHVLSPRELRLAHVVLQQLRVTVPLLLRRAQVLLCCVTAVAVRACRLKELLQRVLRLQLRLRGALRACGVEALLQRVRTASLRVDGCGAVVRAEQLLQLRGVGARRQHVLPRGGVARRVRVREGGQVDPGCQHVLELRRVHAAGQHVEPAETVDAERDARGGGGHADQGATLVQQGGELRHWCVAFFFFLLWNFGPRVW